MTEKERDEQRNFFEDWVTGNGNYPHLVHKSFGGNYLNEEISMKWDGFKAGYNFAKQKEKANV